MDSSNPLKKYLLYSLSFHALVVTLLLLFGGEGPPPPPPKTQVTMIRLSRGAGDLNAPLFQKPAFQPKPSEPQPAAPQPPTPPTPPIPVAKPAPVLPAKPITPPTPTQPVPPKPAQPTVHLGNKPPKPQPPKPAQPPTPTQPAAPAPDEQKLAEALGQVQKELEQREVTAQTAAGAPDGSGTGAPAGVPGGQVGAADPGLAQYQSTVRSKIVRTWVRANTGPDDGQPIRTRVQVRINASGQVIGKNVVKSSGNESFDLSALRAIERASPLPPPPAGLEAEALSEGFVVDFSSRMLGRK